ncbi:MAG: FAD-binding protein [Oceanospirillaceae bacterium]|nr:FAD-binding protein [Oceanospirillaceae bacterium]
MEVLEDSNVFFKENYSLSKFSYARIGGVVQFCCYPGDVEAFTELIYKFRSRNLPFKIVGKTTNLLFLDSVEYACFILTDFLNDVDFQGNKVRVGAGCLLGDFCKDLALRGFSGAEGLEGIPGTIGGALIMNAGAYGYTISDWLINVRVLDTNGDIRTLERRDLVFGNRSAPSLQGMVVLESEFNFNLGDHSNIERLTRRFHISRHAYQEWVYPNLGSIFVVPGLDIHFSVIEKFSKSKDAKLAVLCRTLISLWNLKPMFFIRRSFPEFNFPQRLMGFCFNRSYMSDLASKCTINTFANKNHSSLEVIKYMANVKMNTSAGLKIENEIVLDSVASVINEEQFKKEKKIIEEELNDK